MIMRLPARIASYTNSFNRGLEGLEQNHLAEDCEQWWVFVNLTINLWVP